MPNKCEPPRGHVREILPHPPDHQRRADATRGHPGNPTDALDAAKALSRLRWRTQQGQAEEQVGAPYVRQLGNRAGEGIPQDVHRGALRFQHSKEIAHEELVVIVRPRRRKKLWPGIRRLVLPRHVVGRDVKAGRGKQGHHQEEVFFRAGDAGHEDDPGIALPTALDQGEFTAGSREPTRVNPIRENGPVEIGDGQIEINGVGTARLIEYLGWHEN